MKLATLTNGKRDGLPVLVSNDGRRYGPVDHIAPSLRELLEDWHNAEPLLRAIHAKLTGGGGEPVADQQFTAPLPRAWQWLDASAFESHGELLQIVFNLEPNPKGRPLMYQGMSNLFIAPTADVALPAIEDGIDFEGEFGVITDDVPMGISPKDALAHIKLIVLINDWSLRTIAPVEMKTGFGWVQAKPACSMAPYAVSPDELGDAWQDGRVCLTLEVDWNGKRFGRASGRTMDYGFHELVAHAARTRALCAGTVIGSGTVSNPDYRIVGSSCIAERRGIEIVDQGAPTTNFMNFGDTVRMEAFGPSGTSIFGEINQKVIQS
jgi:fumarylacetoacetate (FAA) hydrolase